MRWGAGNTAVVVVVVVGGELIKEKRLWVPLVRLTLAKARATFSEPAPSVTSDLIRGTTLNSGCEVS